MYKVRQSLVMIFLFALCVSAGAVKGFARWEKSAMEEPPSDIMPPIDVDSVDETIVSATEFRELALNVLRPIHRNDTFCTPVVTRSRRWGLIFRVDVKSPDNEAFLRRVVVWTMDPHNTKSGLGVRYGLRGEGEPLPSEKPCR